MSLYPPSAWVLIVVRACVLRFKGLDMAVCSNKRGPKHVDKPIPPSQGPEATKACPRLRKGIAICSTERWPACSCLLVFETVVANNGSAIRLVVILWNDPNYQPQIWICRWRSFPCSPTVAWQTVAKLVPSLAWEKTPGTRCPKVQLRAARLWPVMNESAC